MRQIIDRFQRQPPRYSSSIRQYLDGNFQWLRNTGWHAVPHCRQFDDQGKG